jgi:hypothetical protein
MTSTLTKALIGFVPVSVLLVYSVALLMKHRTAIALLQSIGALCLMVVVLTHIAEALRLLSAMRFGEPDSIGHFIDLASAVSGVALLVAAVVLRLASRRGQVAG